ncbi:MAG: MFS transporter [Armatimonadetes bacterium]|nr:MFS transporter [Armatimonadota bacterium]
MEPNAKPVPLYRRPAVARLLLIALLVEIGYAVLNISTMPVYLREDRGLSEGIIGLVVVAFLLSEALFKSPMGHLADTYGRRRLMVLGPAFSVATCLFTMLIPHHGWGAGETIALMFLRVMDGIGAAMIWPAAFALMGDLVADNERQESMSLLNTCYLLGIAMALPLGGIFNDLFGRFLAQFSGEKTPSLYFAAFLFMSAAYLSYRYVPSGQEMRSSNVETVHESDKPSEVSQFLNALKSIPQYIVLGLITFAGIGFPMVIIKLFAKDQFNMSETQFGFLVLPGAIAMAVLSVPMSRIGERIGRVRAVHLGLGLCAGGLLLVSAGAVVPWLRSTLALALGGIPLGVGFLLAIPAWYASVSEIDCKRRAVNIGAVMTAQGLGAIIGAPLGGWMYAHFQFISPSFGRYSPFLGCALCVTAAWLLSLRIIRSENVNQPTE